MGLRGYVEWPTKGNRRGVVVDKLGGGGVIVARVGWFAPF